MAHYTILDGCYLVASLPLLHIVIGIFNILLQGTVCILSWVKVLRVWSLHAQSSDPVDQRQNDGDASI